MFVGIVFRTRFLGRFGKVVLCSIFPKNDAFLIFATFLCFARIELAFSDEFWSLTITHQFWLSGCLKQLRSQAKSPTKRKSERKTSLEYQLKYENWLNYCIIQPLYVCSDIWHVWTVSNAKWGSEKTANKSSAKKHCQLKIVKPHIPSYSNCCL